MTLPSLLKAYGVELTLQRSHGHWSAKTTPGRWGPPYPKPPDAVLGAMGYLLDRDLPAGGTGAIRAALAGSSTQTLLGEAGADQ